MPYKDPQAQREYNRQYHRGYYAKHRTELRKRHRALLRQVRDLLDELKDTPCVDCGNSYPPYVMDFDHRDPRRKKFSVGMFKNVSLSIPVLMKEVRKCDVVCANCHRERTHRRK